MRLRETSRSGQRSRDGRRGRILPKTWVSKKIEQPGHEAENRIPEAFDDFGDEYRLPLRALRQTAERNRRGVSQARHARRHPSRPGQLLSGPRKVRGRVREGEYLPRQGRLER